VTFGWARLKRSNRKLFTTRPVMPGQSEDGGDGGAGAWSGECVDVGDEAIIDGQQDQQTTEVVQHGGDVHIEVSLDTSGDPQWHRGHQSPLP
jgi:hypothetical protein